MEITPLYKVIIAGHVVFVMALTLMTWNAGNHLYKNQEIARLKNQLEQAKETSSQVVELAFGKDADVTNVKAIKVTVTSYNPTRQQGWGDGMKTADGNLAKPGVLAISHDLRTRYGLKMGQKVVLKKYGTFVVGDLMHKRWKNKVDIISFIPSWSKKFGVKTDTLYFV